MFKGIRQEDFKDILHIAVHIFRRHRSFGNVLAAFGGGLSKSQAGAVQLAGRVCSISVVVSRQETLLPLGENKIGDLHFASNIRRLGKLGAMVVFPPE